MITEKQIRTLIEHHLDGSDVFVVDVLIKAGNKISVFIDGDQRVTIESCTSLSRFLESSLDREKEDFELTVSSAGADRPLKLPRQYKKNLGLNLEITTKTGEKFTGLVLNADEIGVELEKLPEKKPKKEIEKCIVTIKYPDIKSAKEVITFKK
jgi:ribosome maturation factor RimP